MSNDEEIRRVEISNFLNAFENAKECGLPFEFVEFFLRDYKENGDVNGAIWYAECEWDL